MPTPPGGVFNGDSTDYLATYPGDQWVDVLGYDEYDSDDSADDSSAWINTVVRDMKMVSDQASQRGKIVALTEFGRSGDRKFKESGTGDKGHQVLLRTCRSTCRKTCQAPHI